MGIIAFMLFTRLRKRIPNSQRTDIICVITETGSAPQCHLARCYPKWMGSNVEPSSNTMQLAVAMDLESGCLMSMPGILPKMFFAPRGYQIPIKFQGNGQILSAFNVVKLFLQESQTRQKLLYRAKMRGALHPNSTRLSVLVQSSA